MTLALLALCVAIGAFLVALGTGVDDDPTNDHLTEAAAAVFLGALLLFVLALLTGLASLHRARARGRAASARAAALPARRRRTRARVVRRSPRS